MNKPKNAFDRLYDALNALGTELTKQLHQCHDDHDSSVLLGLKDKVNKMKGMLVEIEVEERRLAVTRPQQ